MTLSPPLPDDLGPTELFLRDEAGDSCKALRLDVFDQALNVGQLESLLVHAQPP
jgi:hypothetical protein